ncbi:MAG TPA: hypothetical protein VGC57_16005 [Cellulomonas sp.]
MTRQIRVGVVMAALALTTTLAACGAGGTDDVVEPSPTTSYGTGPTGATVTVEPLGELDGAAPVELAGVTLLVPDDLEQDPATAAGSVQQLSLRAPGADRAAVIVTVTDQDGADDRAVDASALVAETQLGAGGEWTDLERAPVRWSGLPHAVAITGTLTLPGGEQRDALLVTTRDEAGTRLVSISAEAPAGELHESQAYDVLRTLAVGG